jgi:hypothetical protein
MNVAELSILQIGFLGLYGVGVVYVAYMLITLAKRRNSGTRR